MPKVIRLSCWTNLSIIHFCLSGIIFKTLVFFVERTRMMLTSINLQIHHRYTTAGSVAVSASLSLIFLPQVSFTCKCPTTGRQSAVGCRQDRQSVSTCGCSCCRTELVKDYLANSAHRISCLLVREITLIVWSGEAVHNKWSVKRNQQSTFNAASSLMSSLLVLTTVELAC